MWFSANQGIGGYIQVDFKTKYQVSVIKIRNRDNKAERNKKILITFSEGTSESFDLRDTDVPEMLILSKAVTTSSVNIKVTEVYGQINNGFNIMVLGQGTSESDLVKVISDVSINPTATCTSSAMEGWSCTKMLDQKFEEGLKYWV